jgi:hypothetical protein
MMWECAEEALSHQSECVKLDMIAFKEADLRRTLIKYGISFQVHRTYNGPIVELSDADGKIRYELDAVEV